MSTSRTSKTIHHKEADTLSWFEFINDDSKKLVIPVGPRFQAEIPDFTGPPSGVELRWLGTKDWPINARKAEARVCMIGKGRRNVCHCTIPGSEECVKHHILKKRQQMQSDLGPTFKIWRFDDMGEVISMQWNTEEQIKFINLLKTKRISLDNFFIKQARGSGLSKSRKDIVGYYFNVYIPRRISMQTRFGYKNIDSDDDENEDIETYSNVESSKKQSYQAERISSSNSKHVQVKYLTQR